MDETRVALIRRWSMAGTREDLGMRAEAPLDTHAPAAEQRDEPSDELAQPSQPMPLKEPEPIPA